MKVRSSGGAPGKDGRHATCEKRTSGASGCSAPVEQQDWESARLCRSGRASVASVERLGVVCDDGVLQVESTPTHGALFRVRVSI